jgi:S1-C subfamily serine protease
VISALIAALALAAPPAADAPAFPATVVVVRAGTSCGTGFVWDAAGGLILTALHVVEGAPGAAEVVLASGETAPARVADLDPALDLALLRVDRPLGAALPLGLEPPPAGSVVALAACPAERCARAGGTVLAPARAFAGRRYLAVAAEAHPGSSGAPVLAEGGAVVGVVDLTLRNEPGVALAVPIAAAAARFPRRGADAR